MKVYKVKLYIIQLKKTYKVGIICKIKMKILKEYHYKLIILIILIQT